MTPDQRLAFFSGFVRWMFELVQLVAETVVTGRIPPEEGHEDPTDEVLMVQTFQALHNRGMQEVRALQEVLDKEGAGLKDAIRFLVVMLENRYRGVLEWEMWSEVAQDMQALLVGHCEGIDLMNTSPLSDPARGFVQRWWGRFLPIFRGLDQHNNGLRGTNLWEEPRDMEWPEQEVPEETVDEDPEVRRWCHEADEQAAKDEMEEKELLEVVERHKEELKAARYQEWERRVMQEALEAGCTKRPRLRLSVEVGGASASSSATSHRSSITFPPPPVGEGVHVHFHLEQIMEAVTPTSRNLGTETSERPAPIHVPDSLDLPPPEDAETEQDDSVRLMQTTHPGRNVCTVTDLRHWLETVADPYRKRVIRELLRVLRGRQYGVQTCLRFLESQVSADSEHEDNEGGTLPHYVQLVLMQFAQDLMMSDDDSQPVATAREASAADLRRRRTATSSTTLPFQELENAAGHGIMRTVDGLRQGITNIMLNGNVEHYQDAMRILTIELTRQVHVRASRLRILVMLLSDVLPQPSQQHHPMGEAAMLMGVDAFHETLTQIDLLDLVEFDNTADFLSYEWASANVGPLSQLAIDIMGFLEVADCASDSVESHDSGMAGVAPGFSAGPSSTSPMHSRSPRRCTDDRGRRARDPPQVPPVGVSQTGMAARPPSVNSSLTTPSQRVAVEGCAVLEVRGTRVGPTAGLNVGLTPGSSLPLSPGTNVSGDMQQDVETWSSKESRDVKGKGKTKRTSKGTTGFDGVDRDDPRSKGSPRRRPPPSGTSRSIREFAAK